MKPKQKKAQPEKAHKEHKLLSRVAKMIEPEDEEIVSFTALPPRVDPHKAYRPAKTPQKAAENAPQKTGRRKR